MPTYTVLEALQCPTVAYSSSALPTGPNTMVQTAIEITGYEPWTDFTLENIMNMYEDRLNCPYLGQKEPKPLDKDLFVYDESSVDSRLRRFPFPVINSAMRSMMPEGFGANAPYYDHGSISPCGRGRLKPDWGCVSDLVINEGAYLNLAPGDSKTSAKFGPHMINEDFEEWEKVVTQVGTYSDKVSVRYGYTVSDQEVVIFRFKRERIAHGIAASRSQRPTTRVAIRQLSSPRFPSSDPIPSSVSYAEDGQGGNLIAEYKSILWSEHGRGRLTAKLALAVLAFMSMLGDRYIDYSYPGLNTWRTATEHEGGGIKNNASGKLLPATSRRDVVMEEPGEGKNDDDDDEDEDEDEGEDKLPPLAGATSTRGDHPSSTKKVIRTEFSKQRGTWYYQIIKDNKEKWNKYKKGEWTYDETRGLFVKAGRSHEYVTKSLPK